MAAESNGPDKKAFADHMMDFNRYGYTLIEMILGYDLGLFEIIKNAKQPVSSMEIAELADLRERYVREWLGAMSAAEVIETLVKDGVCLYSLSEENYTIVVSHIALGRGICACVKRLDLMKECFKKEGPIGDASAFEGDFQEFFGGFRTQALDILQQDVFPKIETMTELNDKLGNGCSVLDIGCGTGTLTMAFARKYPNSLFSGVDVSSGVLDQADATLKENNNVHNICFKLTTSENLSSDLNDRFDVVMLFQVLHNLSDPIKMIEDIERVTKPGSSIILLETGLHANHADNVGDMTAAIQYTFSQFYCLPFSMSKRPHIGYGMGWGTEELIKAMSKYFTLDAGFTTTHCEGLLFFTKTPPVEGLT